MSLRGQQQGSDVLAAALPTPFTRLGQEAGLCCVLPALAAR